MLNIRNSLFETNSSSSHSITFSNIKGILRDIKVSTNVRIDEISYKDEDVDNMVRDLNTVLNLDNVEYTKYTKGIRIKSMNECTNDFEFYISRTTRDAEEYLDYAIIQKMGYEYKLTEDDLDQIKNILSKYCNDKNHTINVHVYVRISGRAYILSGESYSKSVRPRDESKAIGSSKEGWTTDLSGQSFNIFDTRSYYTYEITL